MYVFLVQISDQVKATSVIKSDAHSLSEPRKIKKPKKVECWAFFCDACSMQKTILCQQR